MKRKYELTFILSPQLSSSEVKETEKKIEKLVSSADIEVLKKEDWGKRQLEHSINKQQEGVYRHWKLKMDPSSVEKLDQELKLVEGVLRHLAVLT